MSDNSLKEFPKINHLKFNNSRKLKKVRSGASCSRIPSTFSRLAKVKTNNSCAKLPVKPRVTAKAKSKRLRDNSGSSRHLSTPRRMQKKTKSNLPCIFLNPTTLPKSAFMKTKSRSRQYS